MTLRSSAVLEVGGALNVLARPQRTVLANLNGSGTIQITDTGSINNSGSRTLGFDNSVGPLKSGSFPICSGPETTLNLDAAAATTPTWPLSATPSRTSEYSVTESQRYGLEQCGYCRYQSGKRLGSGYSRREQNGRNRSSGEDIQRPVYS